MSSRNGRAAIVASSKTYNRVVRTLSEDFELEAEGSTPRGKFENLRAQLAEFAANVREENNSTVQEDFQNLDELICSAFDYGVHLGFAKALDKFEAGSITATKVRNEERWILSSASKRFQITSYVPSITEKPQKTTSYIIMSEHFFGE